MEITSIFEKTRELLGDLGYNSNLDSSDQHWSDESLIGHLNMALFDFDFKTNSKQIAYEDISYHFNTVVGESIYDLPEDILRVKSVKRDNCTLCEVNYHVNIEHNDQIINHKPEFFTLNYEDKKIKLMPPPDDIYTIKFRGVVAQDDFSLSNLNLELPIPKKYHEFFKYYIASKCLEFLDSDTTSLNNSVYYMNQWNDFCRQVKLEITRRTNNVIYSNNGSYNAW